MNALRRIHAALVSGGIVIDTQPVSRRPPVVSNGSTLGSLDMRDWLATVAAVDGLVAQAVAGGLYAIESEQRIFVTDTWDDGRELVETVSGWQGTRISSVLAARIADAAQPLSLEQEVRLRVLRAL